MTPFKLTPDSTRSICEQVVLAATDAILSGALKPGDQFPSVRTMASDLKIHPDTAHEVIRNLIQERWLIFSPGRGTIVAMPPKARGSDTRRLLNQDIERLVVEARRAGAHLDEVLKSIESHWKRFDAVKIE